MVIEELFHWTAFPGIYGGIVAEFGFKVLTPKIL